MLLKKVMGIKIAGGPKSRKAIKRIFVIVV